MKKILVTGASGFIGKNLIEKLVELNLFVRGTVRKLSSVYTRNNLEYFFIKDINKVSNWNKALKDIDCVIHCAGKAHEMNSKKYSNSDFLINIEGTKNLAEHAAKAGVKRLIFLSSIKVNGENSNKFESNDKKKILTNAFKYNDLPSPGDFYSLSKFEAEKELWKISTKKELEVVVLRLPLVYGRGVKGNLASLIKLINLNIPLPFSLVKNKRSLISIDNLVDLLVKCINHPNAAGRTFLVSDDQDLSTPELIKLISSAMGRKSFLFPIPLFLLKLLGSIFGKQKEINRLIGSLRIDNTYTKETLNWFPKVTVKEGITGMFKRK